MFAMSKKWLQDQGIAIVSEPFELEISKEWLGTETFIEVTKESVYGNKKSIEH